MPLEWRAEVTAFTCGKPPALAGMQPAFRRFVSSKAGTACLGSPLAALLGRLGILINDHAIHCQQLLQRHVCLIGEGRHFSIILLLHEALTRLQD